MYRFESRYKNLSFYYKNKLKKFSNGTYSTEDEKEAEMLIKSNNFKLVEKPAIPEKKVEELEREELVSKAKELGIGLQGNPSNETLKAKIEEAEKEL